MTDQTPEVTDEERRGARVVVGVDGSAGGRAALQFALQDAARRGLPVEAVVAYTVPDQWGEFYVLGADALDQFRAAAVARARGSVDQVLAEGPQPAPEVRMRAQQGSAAEALVQASHGAELLVVGSRGHGGFASMLLGSVSMQCVLHAVCPVTVVHSPAAHRERLHLRRRRAAASQEGLPVG